MTTHHLRPEPSTVSQTYTAPITRRYLAEGWRGLLGWALALLMVMTIYLPLYPSMVTPALQDFMATMPDEVITVFGLDSLSSGAGYTQSSFFGLLGYVLGAIPSIAWGSAAVAGAEESGRLELIMAHAVSRTSYFAQAALALVTRMVVLTVVTIIALLAFNTPAELNLDPVHILTTSLAWAGLCLFCGSLALAVGAPTGRRIWALEVGAGVAVLGYALNAVSNTNDHLNWLAHFSPYAWAFAQKPLATGNGWTGIGLLWGLSLTLFVLVCWAFNRRDLRG